MKVIATWKHGKIYTAENEHKNSVTFDTSGTHGEGPTPMEVVLMGLCGCTAVDVRNILEKKRQPFTSLTVSATAEQAATPPQVFTQITLTYRVTGDVEKKAIEDAVKLSKEKYCSVSAMLSKSAKIDFVIEHQKDETAL
jgi:putative redox protein